jgi:hypothetical protein
MRSVGLFGLAGAIVLAAGVARADDAPAKSAPTTKDGEIQFCIQVIACGTKDGKRRQYPTPCDARADGAKDVSPMVGASCD